MSHALYDRIGIGYSEYRRPDERIATRIDAALGRSRTVLNVGAGAGSYEPKSRVVVAVEPSAEMIRQRPRMAAQSIQAVADRLPFPDRSFDAALAILTIHHWLHRERGLAEMRRVSRERVVIFTWDPTHPGFWLVQDYLPEIVDIDRPHFPSLSDIEQAIGPIDVHTLPVPADCSDGSSVRTGAVRRRTWTLVHAGQSPHSPNSTQRLRLSVSGVISRMEHGATDMARC